MSRKKLLLTLSTLLVLIYFFPLALGYMPYKLVLATVFPVIAFMQYPQAFYNKHTFWLIIGIFMWSGLLIIHGNYERLNWFQLVSYRKNWNVL